MMADLDNIDVDLPALPFHETSVSGIAVDELLRTSFEESTDGKVVSGTYTFSDGGHGEYAYEIGGPILKLIASNCQCKIDGEGFVTIYARTRRDKPRRGRA